MLLMCMTFASCNNESAPESIELEGSLYEVSLYLGGEYVISDDSNTRIDNKMEYYGLEVYCKKADAVGEYTRYAFGLFSDIENLKINLKEGYQYRFECMMIENGFDELLTTGTYPFNGMFVDNVFKYGGNSGFNLTQSYISPNIELEKNAFMCYIEKPYVMMMYGALDDYTPNQKDSAVIPMLRIGYGLKIEVENVPEGELKVNPEEQSVIHVSGRPNEDKAITRDWSKSFSSEGSMQHVFADGLFTITEYSDWQNRIKDFTKSSNVSFVWTHSNGEKETFSKDITFKRNVMNVLKIDFAGKASIKFNLDDSELEDDIEEITFQTEEWDDVLMDVEL